MANQIVVSSGAKVRDLNDVIIGTSGVLSSLAFNVANGVPKLDSSGKILVSQLPNSVMEYLGTWDASTNTPTLVNGTGNAGDVYLCNVAGTVNFGAGPIAFFVGDQVIYSGSIWQRASGATGTVTSVAVTESGDSLNITGSPITTSGTINIGFNGTNLQYVNGAGNLTTFPTLISSIGLSMPSAFSVANSPLTANGTIAVTGAGYPSQYIRGDGTLADFPTSGGGGSSVSYYLNGGTSQGTIGGVTYYEMSKTADTGTMADFSLTGNGFIVAFLTDAGDPAQLNIPAGNWNYEIYASMSANGGTPEMYAELYKYDGTTFTLIATSPHEILYDGTALNLYTFAMTVPATTLALTDRLAIKLYSTNSGGKTTTVHTQDSHLCQIITTFSTGITALNGLTAQVQYFATGTSGTDFAISSATATHTFNLPVASASNTGKLSSTDWSTFNSKANALSGTINTIAYWNSATTISSLALTTYPSLTELSYVKGVTSSIQTQIGTKQATITLTTTGTSGAATLVGATLNIPQYIGGVTSVFGRTGAVVATSGDYTTAQVTESGNLYFTDSRARLALSFVAGSGAYNSTTGVITIPTNNNQITNGAGYTTNVGTVTSVAATGGTGISITGSPITTSGTITITNTLPDQTVALTASTGISVTGTYPNFTITNTSPSSGGTVTSVGLSSATSGVTIGSTPVTTSGTITLAIATATTSQNGLLSSTDWTTFNNKQNALTNPVTGSGAANYIAKWNTSSTITNSLIYDNGTQVGVNTTTMVSLFDVTKNALGTTIVDTSGITLKNGTEALTGVQQISPALHFKSNGWSTTALASQSSDWIMYNLPIQGTNVSNHLIFASAVNGAAYATRLTLTSVGNALFTGSVTALSLVKSGGTSAEILAADGSVITAGTNITISGGSISASGGVTGTGTTNYLPKFTGTSTIGNSQIFDNGTNVGIGNTNTSYTLDVSGTGRFSGILKVDLTGSDHNLQVNSSGQYTTIELQNAGAIKAYPMYWDNTGNAAYVGTTVAGAKLVLQSGANVPTMTLTSTGNVGIGVTPSAWSTGKAIDIGSSGAVFGDGINTAYTAGISQNAYLEANVWKYKISSQPTGRYEINGASHAWFSATSGTAGNAISFTQAMTLNASGNLGIGTANPDNGVLTILKNTSYATENSYAISIQSFTSNAYTELQIGAADAIDCGVIQTAGKNTSWTSKNLSLQPNGGNVLIGTTTNAGYKLDVNGTGRFYNTGGSNTLIISGTGSPYKSILELQYAATLYGATLTYDANSESVTLENYGRSASGTTQGDINFRTKVSNTTPTNVLNLDGFTGAATFTGNITLDKSSPNISINTPSGTSGQYNINNGVGSLMWAMYSTTGGSNTQGNWQLYSAGKTGGAGNIIDITPAGAATFSSDITATYGIFTGSGIRIESNSAGSAARFLFNYTSNASSRSWRLVNDYDAYGDFQIQQSTTQTGSTYSKILGFSSTGAATFSSSVTATSFFESSDKRLKKEISENPTIDGISQIKPKLYIKDGKEELGYYAQDLEQVLPSSVSEGKDGFLALSYTQVHTAKIAQLESKIEQLEKLIYELGRNK